MEPLAASPVFRALTQPQMFAGVTYNFFVINLVVTTELFLITRSGWSLLAALILHAAGYLACLHDPRIFDIWIAKTSRCARVRNFSFWRCNSYMP
ncbi:MAG: VirB3 family type IV secretion system protein [Pseudomonadota bacterium]